jgi:Pectate lyase superfamily protein
MTTLKPETFGAKGDGRTDDTAALKAAFAALAPADTLQVRGTYRHSSPLTVTKNGVRVKGGGQLVATNSKASALVIAAHDVVVEDLTLSVVTTVRQTTNESAALLVGPSGPVRGFIGRRLHLDGAGAMLRGQSYGFLLEDVLVTNSMGDGIHMTDGVHDGLVLRPTVLHSGDDGVAVVSYLSNTTPCRDIEIRSPRVRDVYHGRGLSVVGGTRVRILDIDVSQTSGAAVYVACEDNRDWRTHPPREITVRGGLITAANTTCPRPDHGAVLVVNESSNRPIDAVTVSGLVIRDTHAIYRAVGFLGGPGGGHTRCALSDVVISGSCPRLVTQIEGGTVDVRDVRVGVTQFVPHPVESWLTNPNGRVSGAHGSTAVLLDGSYWYKMTTGDMSGWQRLSGSR